MTVCIFVSDLHTREIDPPPGDILINCGDITFQGTKKEVAWYTEWLKKQRPKYKQIVWIAGNHDFNAHYWGPEVAKETDTIYLHNSGCEVEGLKIWGSPFSPTFGDWYAMRNRGDDIQEIWNMIPEGMDIVLAHSPALGILDTTPYENHPVGCKNLLETIKIKKPRVLASGHLHDCGGRMEEHFGITFVNAAICDEQYNPTNQPVVLEL